MMKLSRRTALRGLGATIALPWLEAMAPPALAVSPVPSAHAVRRTLFLFIPNGVHAPDWTPQGDGSSFALSPLLEPLRSVRSHVSVLSGLTHNNARALGDGPGDHARSAACYLTGAHPVKTAGDDIAAGVSADQVLARHLRGRTRLASLELGCEPAMRSGDCDSGYSCAYSANISWRAEDLPMAKEVDPRRVFDRLFMLGDENETPAARHARLARRGSILDHATASARRLRDRLGAADRRRVEEYLDGVRELEQRLQAMQAGGTGAPEGVEAPAPGVPADYTAHISAMNELIVLALRLDLTRVISFMYANEGSNRPFPALGISEGHHHLSHHGGNEAMVESIRRINRFQIERFGDLLQRLADARDADDAPLLDSTLVMYGAAISDGNAHNHEDLPILLAGRGGGMHTPGRHIRYATETPLCNLFVSMLQNSGVETNAFGDSTGALTGLA